MSLVASASIAEDIVSTRGIEVSRMNCTLLRKNYSLFCFGIIIKLTGSVR